MKTIKEALKANFSRAAENYDHFAGVQKSIGRRLLTLLPSGMAPSTILDLGCGSGSLCNNLLNRFPMAEITGLDIAPGMIDYCRKRFKDSPRFKGICDDGEFFRGDSPFDLVISNYSIQWFEDKTGGIKNLFFNTAKRIALSIPLAGSFYEFYHCLSVIKNSAPPLTLLEPEEWERLFAEAGFIPEEVKVTKQIKYYSNAREVLKSFNNIGAVLKGNENYSPLNLKELRSFFALYKEKFENPGKGVPVTYKSILYTGKRGNSIKSF